MSLFELIGIIAFARWSYRFLKGSTHRAQH